MRPGNGIECDGPSNPGYAKDPKLRRARGMKIAEDPTSYGADEIMLELGDES